MTFPLIYSAAGVANTASVDYVTSGNSTSDLSTYTFSSVSLGLETPSRLVVVAVAFRASGGRTIASVTVGGNSATQAAVQYNGGNGVALYTATASGSAGDIVLTLSSGALRAAYAVWAINDITSSSPVAIVQSTSDPASYNSNVVANDIGIVATISTNSPTNSMAGVSENFDFVIEGNLAFAGGSQQFLATESPRTISSSWTSPSDQAGVFALWR